MKALQSDAPLIVYVDIKSPYAFVAIKPTLALEKELGVQFDWRGLTLDIPSFLGSARKSKGKVVKNNRSASQWSSVKYAYADARRYAQRQGHKIYGTEKIWDSSIPHIGLNWVVQQARERLPAYFDAVYPRFWQRDLDIEDPQVVLECIRTSGAPVDGFEEYLTHEGRAQHDALQAQLHPAGIYGVPSYVFGEHILFGREHLPYISWYLRGKVGPAPDLAYSLEDAT